MAPVMPLRLLQFTTGRATPQREVRHRGFTMVELLVTMVVLGILVAIAAPAFREMILNQGIRTASFDLFSALEYTRSEAIKRNGSVTLRAGPKTDAAWTTGWRVVDASSNTLRSWTAASGLTIAEKAGSVTSITFGKDGHMSSPATAKLEIKSTAALSGVNANCIRVDLIGRAWTKTGACP